MSVKAINYFLDSLGSFDKGSNFKYYFDFASPKTGYYSTGFSYSLATGFTTTVGSTPTGSFATGNQIFTSTPTQTTPYYQVNIGLFDQSAPYFTYSSSNPSVSTINSSGRTQYISDGVFSIGIQNGNITENVGPFSIQSGFGPSSQKFSGFKTGSFGYVVSTGIDLRISGKPASTGTMLVYSKQDHTNSSYIRNTGCWAYGLDLTPMSPWNSNGGNNKAGTLVTPRHIIYAWHYQIGSGDTVRFVDKNNTVYNRIIKGIKTMSGADLSHDLVVAALDSDLPTGIAYCKVLPNNFSTYVNPNYRYIPVMQNDQEEKALIKELDFNDSSFRQAEEPTRSGYYENAVGGDSGSPTIIYINNIPVLLTVDTFAGGGNGTSILSNKIELNKMISGADVLAGVITNYTLTDVSLTGINV